MPLNENSTSFKLQCEHCRAYVFYQMCFQRKNNLPRDELLSIFKNDSNIVLVDKNALCFKVW